MKTKSLIYCGVLILSIAMFTARAGAQGSSSNFRIDESFIGPGGSLESESSNYKTAPGGQSLGNSAAGDNQTESESSNYRSQPGATTTDDPSLSCSLDTNSLDFGALSTSATATETATFSVSNYTSYGYVVQIIGDTPTNGSYNLTALSSNDSSTTGTEQFGINLVDNATPDIGADPDQIPDGTFSFGEAATNYDTPDSYRYVNGDTIARSLKTSGQTDYTISYIINSANTTPGGSYSGDQTIICIGTF